MKKNLLNHWQNLSLETQSLIQAAVLDCYVFNCRNTLVIKFWLLQYLEYELWLGCQTQISDISLKTL